MTAGEHYSPRNHFVGPVCPRHLAAIPFLSGLSKLLLLVIFNFCGPKDSCNPSLVILAKAVGRSVDRVSAALQELMEAGFIARKRRGPGQTATIHLIWHEGLESSLRNSSPDSADVQSLDAPEIPQIRGVSYS